MPEPLDAYKVLQVDPEAEDEVVQAAYRRLARKYHPDMGGGADAVARMAAINAAWALIGKPDARAGFDRARSLAGRAGPPRPAAQATSDGAAPTPGGPPPGGPPPGGPPRGTPTAGHPHGASDATGRPPDTVSRDWTSGRSTQGGGFDDSMRAADGLGAAGRPPGPQSGSVLTFGRYNGWSLGEIARRDLEYLEWLDRTPIGRAFRYEIDAILRSTGRRRSADTESTERRGLFRRR